MRLRLKLIKRILLGRPITTGWEGWRYSKADLEDIVELLQSCGLGSWKEKGEE